MEIEQLNTEVERLLKRSEVFGWIWLMGIGSVICIASAYKAGKLAKNSGMQRDVNTAKLYLLGIVGLVISIAAIAAVILFKKDKQS